jgi:UDP-GlcNAc3NAcA epimerase
MRITTIVGARPQFVKAAVVSRAFREQFYGVHETIIHTGQHYDANMSDVFFDELNIPWPDHNLGIGGGTHGQNTGRMIEAIEAVLHKEKSDYVLVYGDTDSTLAGALAAVKLQIPVAHVEAGLRSFNRQMPEEINRVLTDHLAQLLFTPTDTATHNLVIDNIEVRRVHQVGDVMYDAALYYRGRSQRPSNLFIDGGYILATLHRAENTDNLDRLKQIISALNKIAFKTPVVMPLHPRTRKLVHQCQLDTRNITLLEPVSYLQMVWLLEHCKLVVTDSGGLQKEAYFFGKPCITTRDETEWVELVEAGWNYLVGASESLITSMCLKHDLGRSQVHKPLYGEGDAGLKIAEILAV